MKTKLQALIEEQKALTARFEELLTSEQFVDANKKFYIKGHPTRGAEVIKMLEDLGGENKRGCKGTNNRVCYYIRNDRQIDWDLGSNMFCGYTELHLPEEVNEENTQTTDIKVGDWIQFTMVNQYRSDYEINYLLSHEVEVKAVYANSLCVCIPSLGATYHHFDYASFHKVEPPKEKVALIAGEVYSTEFGDISLARKVISNTNVRIFCALYRTGVLSLNSDNGFSGTNATTLRLATPEQRKQLFDALEKAGKYFDKENMRLLDVEEWSGRLGEAFIYMTSHGLWEASIFDDKSNYNNTPFYSIPYNDETKKLVGTTDIPDKHYKFVE